MGKRLPQCFFIDLFSSFHLHVDFLHLCLNYLLVILKGFNGLQALLLTLVAHWEAECALGLLSLVHNVQGKTCSHNMRVLALGVIARGHRPENYGRPMGTDLH